MRERKELSVRISTKTRDALQHKIARGEDVGRAPYGYRYVDGKLVEIPEERWIVRRILRNYRNGVGFTEIAERLNKRSVKSQTGKPSTPQMVQQIIRTNR